MCVCVCILTVRVCPASRTQEEGIWNEMSPESEYVLRTTQPPSGCSWKGNNIKTASTQSQPSWGQTSFKQRCPFKHLRYQNCHYSSPCHGLTMSELFLSLTYFPFTSTSATLTKPFCDARLDSLQAGELMETPSRFLFFPRILQLLCSWVRATVVGREGLGDKCNLRGKKDELQTS